MRRVNNDDAMKIINRSRRKPHDDIRIDHLMGTKCCHYAIITAGTRVVITATHFLLRSPSIQSISGVLTLPNRHTCHCKSSVKQFEDYEQYEQYKQWKQCKECKECKEIT